MRKSVINEGKFSISMADKEGNMRYSVSSPVRPPTLGRGKSKSSYGKELYALMLVTCYSESEVELRNTFDSLAMTEYNEDYKVLFIIADGMVKGRGNEQTTPDIVLGLMELDPHWPEAQAYPYMAIGEGAKGINYAKVYVGWYNYEDRSVPTVVVVKTGAPAEKASAKPGNRGKRDSQVLLMRFLEHITFNDRMCPFEYELFQKLHYLMGVTPDNFETVLMVDADTKVAPDSLARMVACMKSDPKIMGLCGETRIANKRESYVHFLTRLRESRSLNTICLIT
jgi:chitin synthase